MKLLGGHILKKVLVVSGSPRKNGNTIEIVKRIENSMTSMAEEIKFEYIHLIEKDLKYCRGCTRCLTHGGESCPLKDDKDMILSEMHKADALIFASPGYSHMVSGLFKNFIDRFMFLDHIPELINKPTLILSTTGGDGVSGAPNYMNKKAFLWWGCNIVDTIGIAHAFYKLNEKYRKKTIKRLDKVAILLLSEMQSNRQKTPTFGQYMCFKLNQAELIISPTVMPYRTEVWSKNNWMKQDYYYPVRVKLLYRFVGASMIIISKAVFRIMLGKDMDIKMKQYLDSNLK